MFAIFLILFLVKAGNSYRKDNESQEEIWLEIIEELDKFHIIESRGLKIKELKNKFKITRK